MADAPNDEALAYMREAEQILRTGNSKEAERRLGFALDVLARRPDPRVQARVLESYATIQTHTGRLPEAEQSTRAALACWLKVGDRAEEARVLGRLALLYLYKGELEDAEFWLHSSLTILRDLDAKAAIADLMGSLATVELRRGNLETAAAHAHEGIELAREVHDSNAEANLLIQLSQIQMRMLDFTGAHESITRGQEILDKRETSRLSTLRAIRAAVYRREKRPAEAEAELLIAAEQKRAAEDLRGEAGVLNTLALVLLDYGLERLPEAERHLLRAIELFRGAKDIQNVANSLVNLGSVYEQQGRTADHEVVLRDALKVYERIGAPEPIASARGSVAFVVLKQGRIAEAAELYKQALELVRDFAPADMNFPFLLAYISLLLLRGDADGARGLIDHTFKKGSPTVPQQCTLVLPARIRIALFERDVTAAAALMKLGKDAVAAQPEAQRDFLSSELKRLEPELEAAQAGGAWPLFNGHLPDSIWPAARAALLVEMSERSPEALARLIAEQPDVHAAMQAE